MLALAKGFRDRGLQNVIVGTKASGRPILTEQDGISVWRVPLANLYWPTRTRKRPFVTRRLWHFLDSYNWVMRYKLTKILKQERPDVCVIHGLSGWSVAALAATAGQDIPTLQVLHDFYYVCPNTMMRSAESNCTGQCISCKVLRLPHRRLSNQILSVVGVSRFVLKRHRDLGYFSKVPLTQVIHNVVTIKPLLRQRTQSSLEVQTRKIRFGFIGTLAPHKGIEFLLKAFRDSVLKSAVLVIAGGGKSEYVAMLHRKWSCPEIKFIGQVEPDQFFNDIDVCVVPSLWNENFPGVICESLAYGVKVIGSNRGGIPEMIQEGYNGFLFDPEIPKELENILIKFVNEFEIICHGRQIDVPRPDAVELSRELWITQYISLLQKMCINRKIQ
jgi:glycosyltransferase involved in cell wall biosynthesis